MEFDFDEIVIKKRRKSKNRVQNFLKANDMLSVEERRDVEAEDGGGIGGGPSLDDLLNFSADDLLTQTKGEMMKEENEEKEKTVEEGMVEKEDEMKEGDDGGSVVLVYQPRMVEDPITFTSLKHLSF